MSATLLDQALNDLESQGDQVVAVMPVDLLGRTVDHDALADVVDPRRIPLVVDAAESVGAAYRGRPAGSFGLVAALSFNGNKVMTTSGGGMLLSDDGAMIERARYLATQAREPVAWYEHTEDGYNYRLSNLLAALGRVQLARLDEMIARRRAIRSQYAAALEDVPGVRILGRDGDRTDHEDNCWLTAIVLDPDHTQVSADDLIAALDAADIEARHLWKPMHLQPLYAHARSHLDGTSDRLFARGVTLPSGSGLSDDQIARVIAVLGDVLGGRTV